MKKILIISAVALAVLSACSNHHSSLPHSVVASQEQGSIIKSPNDTRAYKTFVLPNKLEVVLVSDPSAEKSAAALSVAVGMLQDPMSQQGMAHYLEHMLFLGTERYPDTKGYSEFMAANGGAHNAYTWLDITNYMLQINNNAYDEALDRFADFFKAPKLYPEYVEKEKNAVNAEWSMRREMDFFGQYNLSRSMLGEHPANRFIIGNLESLGDKEGSALHAETVAFYQKYYSANIMKLALISNQPLAEMEALARKHFSTIENKNIEKPTVSAKIDFSQVGSKRIHYVPNEDVKQLKLDFIISDNSEQDAFKPNEFLSHLIGSEKPGSVAYELKNMGLISSLNAGASPTLYGNYGSFTIDVTLTDAGMQNREGIVAAIMQYIDLIRKNGVDEKYAHEIKAALANQFRFLEKTNGFDYVSNLAAAMQNKSVEQIISAPFTLERFDKASIENVLAELTPERLRVWYISKKEPSNSKLHFYDGKYKIVDISEEEKQSWTQSPALALSLPAVNTLLAQNFDLVSAPADTKPHVVFDENGIKAWLAPSKLFANQPRGSMEFNINTDFASKDVSARVMQSLWRDLFSLSQSELLNDASLAGMSFQLVPAQGMSLRVSGFTDKQAELLEKAVSGLVIDVPEQALEQAKERFIRGLNNQSKAFPFQQAFNQYGKITRAGSYENKDLIEAAKKITPNELKAFINKTLSANNIRVFAFGNYDKNSVIHAINTVEKALPKNRVATAFVKAKDLLPKAGTTLVVQQDIDIADVGLVDVHFHQTPSVEQQARARVIARHFGNVAFDKLRTEEQLAYAVGGSALDLGDYAGFVMYIQTPVKGVKAMQERFDNFKVEYAKELDALTEEAFSQLKASLLVTLKEPAKNLQEEVAPLFKDWSEERFNFDSKEQLIKAVEQVTLADAKAFYQEAMLNKNAARISVQMRGTSFKAEPFADFVNQIKITDVAEFQKSMQTQ